MSKELAGAWPPTLEFDHLDAVHASVSTVKERLFVNHLVILKGIGDMSVQQFADFTSQLGELERPLANTTVHSTDQRVEILQRKASDNHYQHSLNEQTISTMRKPSSFYWHADRSFLARPSFLTATRVVTAPEVGGTTDFINTELAYASLTKEDATLLKNLIGVHSYAHYHEKLAGEGIYTSDEVAQKHALYPQVEHPLVTAHPITGRVAAYISPLTLERVLGSEEDVIAAKDILASMLDETKPSYYSHTWRDGDVVIWDNFGVLHRGSASQGERELQRVTIALPYE